MAQIVRYGYKYCTAGPVLNDSLRGADNFGIYFRRENTTSWNGSYFLQYFYKGCQYFRHRETFPPFRLSSTDDARFGPE